MASLELRDLAAATGAVVLRGAPEGRVTGYGVDSRTLTGGSVFFALPGARTDGHRFLENAARAGATAAFVTRDLENGETAPPCVLRVPDAAAALGRCGALARRKLGLRVVAVAGSVGKTTTKELVAAGISADRAVHRTPGNWNNELGVPLTLLGCPDDTAVAVLELGTRGHGQVAYLAELAAPDVGLVTNVRPEHLEFFGDLDGVAAAEGELYACLGNDAIAVVNLDDEHARVQAARHAGRRVTFGRHASADFLLESVEDRFTPGAAFVYRHGGRSSRVQLRIGGSHAAMNALAALAAAAAVGTDPQAAASRMEEVEPAENRGRILRLAGGVVVVNDTYNSSPAALASVLETLKSSPAAGRKIVVIGDMLELGPESPSYHRRAGLQAADAGARLVVGVGPLSRAAVEAARKAGVPETYHLDDAAAAAEALPSWVGAGDLVLVKGSRGIRLEQVVAALAAARGEEA